MARLKKAAILIGSRRVQKQKTDNAMDLVYDDEEEPDLEYDLLAPNQIAVADDGIILQQFDETIFCAPQEHILEGECGQHKSLVFHFSCGNCRFLLVPWMQTAQ
jgi:hypothetical protein